MFETGRRSAISSSELGLYSDRTDGYNRSKYGSVVRKFVIVVMAIVAVILAAIFIYDFAAGASSSSKVSQETKHIYILQNALKKPNYYSKKLTTTSALPKPEVDQLTSAGIQDRSDDDVQNMAFIDIPHAEPQQVDDFDEPEIRSQTLENFKLKKRLVESQEEDDGDGEVEGKQLISNHAVVYRVRQMYQHPHSGSESPEESRPTPFHFEMKSPHPESFKRIKFPQLTQYRYPQSSKNIQDIIKYLTNDPGGSKRGIKFNGVYINPKKYDHYSDIGEMMANSDRTEMSSGLEESEEEMSSPHMSISHNDPLFPFKPKHPTDVNLLAPTNFRFSPSALHRYHPYFDTYYQRPMMTRPPASHEQTYDSAGAYSANFGKKKKPKPFSVMLDIYPITDLNEQPTNKKVSRPRPLSSSEEYIDPRGLSTSFVRGGRLHPGNYAAPAHPIPVIAIPANQQGTSDEDEKQQMIFHLNLYPRKKNGLSRNDLLRRSEYTDPETQENFFKKVMSPFDTITKQLTDHTAIEDANLEDSDTLALTRYEETPLDMENEKLDQYSEKKNLNSIRDENKMTLGNTLNDIEKPVNEAKEDEKNSDTSTTGSSQKFADGLVALD